MTTEGIAKAIKYSLAHDDLAGYCEAVGCQVDNIDLRNYIIYWVNCNMGNTPTALELKKNPDIILNLI